MLLIITSTDDELLTNYYDEMDGDRLRLPANRNCYRLSHVL